MTDGDRELHAKARYFAESLTATFRGIRADAPEFSAKLQPKGPHVWVTVLDTEERQRPVVFAIDGTDRLRLDVEFRVCWDKHKKFLAVEQSRLSCSLLERQPAPLFRYEYVRRQTSPPAAHLHVHAHRDEAAFLLRLGAHGRGGNGSKQGRVARLQEVHFPVGGHRFRPCVEEVLWMMVEEFGVDCEPSWRSRLTDGMAAWREIQLRSAVRDNARIAASALADLGYTVAPPPDGHPREGSNFAGR